MRYHQPLTMQLNAINFPMICKHVTRTMLHNDTWATNVDIICPFSSISRSNLELSIRLSNGNVHNALKLVDDFQYLDLRFTMLIVVFFFLLLQLVSTRCQCCNTFPFSFESEKIIVKRQNVQHVMYTWLALDYTLCTPHRVCISRSALHCTCFCICSNGASFTNWSIFCFDNFHHFRKIQIDEPKWSTRQREREWEIKIN